MPPGARVDTNSSSPEPQQPLVTQPCYRKPAASCKPPSQTTPRATHTSTATYKYSYDTAGRLVTAVIPGHALTYGFEPTNTCGAGTSAAANGNRTTTTDVPVGGNGLEYSTRYCYDADDRLSESTETVTGASSAPAGMVRPAVSLVAGTVLYDRHGNVTRLGDQTFTYLFDDDLDDVAIRLDHVLSGANVVKMWSE